MFFVFKRIILLVMSFFAMFPNLFSFQNFDSVAEYKKAVASVDIYENTLDTAVPQTEVYNIISNFFAEELPEGKTEKKAIVLGYDGCRADALSLMKDAEESGIQTLMEDGGKTVIGYCGGTNYPNLHTQATSTAPGWCTMLTGTWADVHGITDNGIEKSNDHLTLLTTLVEDGEVDDSAFYVSWGGHFNGAGTTYWQERQYCENNGLDVTFKCNADDNGTFDAVMNDITSADCSDFIFSIFEFCDHNGHGDNFYIGNDSYKQAFADAENASKACIEAIKARATYDTEDWLIIITSDHGGFKSGHGGNTIQERMIFITTNKDVDYAYPVNSIVC